MGCSYARNGITFMTIWDTLDNLDVPILEVDILRTRKCLKHPEICNQHVANIAIHESVKNRKGT